MKYYLKALKNYATFSGRANRSEYWYFVLFNIIFAVAAAIVDNVIGTTIKMDLPTGVQSLPYGYIYLAYGIAVLIPGLAALVRRLHDVNKSGWFFLVCLIPIAGAIWLLILLVKESNIGENKYGAESVGITEA
jgi:uncharacterized membrane protein YhaH (DUF805 family)